MAAPVVTITIEPDGVRAGNFVVTWTIDGVESERRTWATLEAALAQIGVRLYQLAYRVLR